MLIINWDVGSVVIGFLKTFEINIVITEDAPRVLCKNDGILITLLVIVHETDERMADGEVVLDIWHVGEEPMVVIVEGICNLNWEFWSRLLKLENVMLRVMADSTVLTSALTVTLIKALGVGVIVKEPVAMLFPPLEINMVAIRGDVSIRHWAMKLDSYILYPTEISVSDRLDIVNLYWVELLETNVRPINFVVS